MKSWLTTTDHKRIGLLYFWTAFGFFLIGGLEAMIIRAQLIKLPARVIRSAAPNAIRSTSEPAVGRRLARLAHRGHRSNAPDRSLITRSTIGPIRRPHWKGRPDGQLCLTLHGIQLNTRSTPTGRIQSVHLG